MRARLADILAPAQATGHAIPACNVYTIDQAAGVLDAASVARTAVILQVHPDGVGARIWALAAGLRVLADEAPMPVALQLDHCVDRATLERAMDSGFDGLMADGAHLDPEDNARFVSDIAAVARIHGISIEAELGRLAGSEDGIEIAARQGRLTAPERVADFLAASGADLLAVSIGNVHGATRRQPMLDLDRLAAIRAATTVPLVLHGGSGLDDGQVRAAIGLGICKVNVNTEIRAVYRDALVAAGSRDMAAMLAEARGATRDAMSMVIDRLGCAGSLDHGMAPVPGEREPVA